LGARAFANAAAVFIEGDVAHPVQAVFDGPMSTAQIQQAGRVGLLGGEAGDAVDGFGAPLFAEQLSGIALDTEDLADVGEVQIAVQFGVGPDVTDFQAAVGFIGGGVLRGEKRSD
jgi:hypothetical protein